MRRREFVALVGAVAAWPLLHARGGRARVVLRSELVVRGRPPFSPIEADA